jgi:hypothetical protein
MNIFRNLFSREKVDESNDNISKPINIQKANTISPIQKLLIDIKGKGRTEYPFLHPKYSPSSRIPCIDFTPFIKDRLLANDIKSITALMKGVIRANPGLGIGAEWIGENIKNLLSLDFNRYINYKNKEALTELKAIWILAEKSGGGREFWITERESFTKYFSVALACQPFKVSDNFSQLVKNANSFIKTMRKDVPYWESFPLYQTNYTKENNIPSNEFSLKYNSLTIGGRLHLFEALNHISQSLTDCSNYNLRSLGINSVDTIEEIILSQILLTEKSIVIISPFEYLTKNELLKLLDSKNIAYKKSWNKDKLLNAIIETDASIIDEFMSDKQKERAIIKYQVNPQYANDVDILLKTIEETKVIYNLLCFIDSKYGKVA